MKALTTGGTARLLVLLFSFAAPGQALSQDVMTIPRLTGPITLDGASTEAAWDGIPTLPMTTYEPAFGVPPGERTEVRIAHDGTYLYVAGRFYDSRPAQLRAQSLTRDRVDGDDHFQLVVDGFQDRESALTFVVTPAGTRQDAAISGDAEGRDWLNLEWNALWDARSIRTDEGWFLEMRIPFSSLRFQPRGDRVLMGIGASRLISRTSERHVFPAIRPDRSSAYLKPSLLQAVALDGVRPRLPLYLTPFALTGMRRAYASDPSQGAGERSDRLTRELGADLKYSLTSNLTLDLTANTDFAQVEADDQQINLGRYSLFVPEKRPFFQERAGIFYFSLGGVSRLFHSRRIGLSDAGQPIPILGGVRIAGRVGEWDVGALNVQTRGVPEQGAENFGVVRVRRQVLNANSTIGALLTTRVGAGSSTEVAAGLDGTIRLFGDDYLTFNLASTAGEGSPGAIDAGFASATLRRRRAVGWSYQLGGTYSGPAFDPAVGVELVKDYSYAGGGLSHGWSPSAGSRLRRHAAAWTGGLFRNNSDGRLDMATATAEWSYESAAGSTGSIQLNTRRDELPAPFSLPGGTQVPAGAYAASTVQMQHRTPLGRALVVQAGGQAGRYFDGWRLAPRLSPTWYLSPRLELGGDYELNRIRFPEPAVQPLAHPAAALAGGAAGNVALVHGERRRTAASGALGSERAADGVADHDGATRFRRGHGGGRDPEPGGCGAGAPLLRGLRALRRVGERSAGRLSWL
jgi:hypothetical protein